MSGADVTAEAIDCDDVRIATGAADVLTPFNLAGVLGPADVHGARTLSRITGDRRDEILLAAALALRAPRHGHVCVDLGDVASTVTVAEGSPVEFDELPWPAATRWRASLLESPLVRVRAEGTPTRAELRPELDRPLVLVGERVYLDRYWRYERRVAEALRRRAARVDGDVDPHRVREILDRLLPPGPERPDRQRLAVATAARRDLTVIAGGPGTGKTHVIARLLALLHELVEDGRPRIAIAAPTGKAADRLTNVLRSAVEDEDAFDVPAAVRERLRALEATTLHRLLGWNPGSATRFRHDRNHKLPHRAVIVDETSMVDLPLMSKLVEALRPEAKLVLVGDPDQLASVEAGAVLADIVGSSADELRMTAGNRDALRAATGEPLDEVTTTPPVADPADAGGIDDAVVVLGAFRRFAAGSGIARFAAAIHAGEVGDALEVLRGGAKDLTWVEATGEANDRAELAPVRERVGTAGRALVAAARRGDAAEALRALDDVRVLTAHRRGRYGVGGWVPLLERWLSRDVDSFEVTERFYVGRPVMITRNDPRLRLYNGDVGVVVRSGDTVEVAFHGSGGVRNFAPSRLEELETVHAMTIHKSQGSQFGHVVVVLPDEGSQVLTRELLYTAVTRAQRGVTLVATEEVVRSTVERRVTRASGLRSTMWGGA